MAHQAAGGVAQQAPGAYPWGQQGGAEGGYDYNYGYGYAEGYTDYSGGYGYEGYGGGWDQNGQGFGQDQGYGNEWYDNSGGDSWQRGGAGGNVRGRGGRGGDRGQSRGRGDRGRGQGPPRGGRGGGGDRGGGGFGARGRGDGSVRGRGGRGEGGGRGMARGNAGGGGGRGGGFAFGRGGRGSGDRGRGGPPRGRGSDSGGQRGRGFGRGGRGDSAGRGRGMGFGRGRGGFGGPPATSDDSDGGISSLGDLVQRAKVRKMIGEYDLSPDAPMQAFLERWKAFASTFTDCGNPISNLECSLKASKVTFLQLHFDCKFLVKCNIYSIFTGALFVHKLRDGVVHESMFFARGLGLNKKSCKMDAYEKAYKLLMNATVGEIMSQEDCGEASLRREVQILHTDDPRAFNELMRRSNALEEIPVPAPPPLMGSVAGRGRGGGGGARGAKRPSAMGAGGPNAKRSKFPDQVSDMLEQKSLSLAPTKRVGVLMNKYDPLIMKMEKLKALLKEEGITKLHIVPKIDQLAHKTAIHIQNVYRFEEVPMLGFENRMPVYCEIYFDGVFMAHGNSDPKRNMAMQSAYGNLANVLCSQTLEVVVNNPRRWRPDMAHDPDVCNVVTKWQGEDNNSLLTSNLANMKQMMQSMPDLFVPIDRMVITEHEADVNMINVFKVLELSATRNLMLLECEIIRNPAGDFTCSLSLQGRVLTSRTHSTKNGAKRLCSEAVMKEMKKTHDVIYVYSEYTGKTIGKQELLRLAAQKTLAGEPPAKIFYKGTEHKEELNMAPEQLQKIEEDRRKNEEFENLPENVNARPLFPWIAATMYDIIDDYYKKVTLEDLMLDVTDMPKSQRDVVTSCAAKMGLRVVTRTKGSTEPSLLRRTVTAQDMLKILQLHNGQSGRYKMVTCTHPSTQEELDKFKEECLEKHRKLVEARINDDPNVDKTAVKTEATYNPKPLSEPPAAGSA